MKKQFPGVCVAALFFPAVASAAAPGGQLTAYLANPVIDYGSTRGNSGTGLGVRGWGMLHPNWVVHGEYETTKMEETATNVESLRLGPGFVGGPGGETLSLVKAEYVDFGSDLDQSGFGVHGGLILEADSALSYMGTLGYVRTDDTDGPELNVGVHYAFNPRWGAVFDHRNYLGSADPSGDLRHTLVIQRQRAFSGYIEASICQSSG